MQGFGHEDKLIEKYKELLSKDYWEGVSFNVKVGCTTGFSQFTMFAVFAGIFFFGGLVIESDFPETTPE